MSSLFARSISGQTHRIGTRSLVPRAGSRTPLVVPEAVPVARWPLAVLTLLLAVSAAALATNRFTRDTDTVVAPVRWTADTRPVSVSIADRPFSIPANLIADGRQRSGGAQGRIDLVVRWPSLAGYDASHAALFDDGARGLIRIWLEEGRAAGAGSADPAGADAALRPEIYPVAGGLFARAFAANSDYASEEIVYEASALRTRTSAPPFAARCQKWNAQEATCLRRVPLAPGLTMTYRFPRARLADWGRLEHAVTGLVTGFMAQVSPRARASR